MAHTSMWGGTLLRSSAYVFPPPPGVSQPGAARSCLYPQHKHRGGSWSLIPLAPIAPPVTHVTDVTVDGPRVIAVTEVMGVEKGRSLKVLHSVRARRY